jgi:hypothetical protein
VFFARQPFQQNVSLSLLKDPRPTGEAPLFPLSSRPKRSEVERSLCGCSFLGMSFDREVMGHWAHPRVMHSAPVQQLLSLEAPLFPLSSRPKRSEVERSLCGCSFLGMFFDREVMGHWEVSWTRSFVDKKFRGQKFRGQTEVSWTDGQCVGDRILHTICCSRTMDLGLHIAVHARKKSFLRHTAEADTLSLRIEAKANSPRTSTRFCFLEYGASSTGCTEKSPFALAK